MTMGVWSKSLAVEVKTGGQLGEAESQEVEEM